MKTKEEIIKEIKDFGFPACEVAINFDDFFNNKNFSVSCIGVNIFPNPPSPEKFYQILNDLILSKKVEKIFVRISDIDDPENWFYSDTIYIISNLKIDELKKSIKILQPDEIFENWMYGKPVNVDTDTIEKCIFSIWWD